MFDTVMFAPCGCCDCESEACAWSLILSVAACRPRTKRETGDWPPIFLQTVDVVLMYCPPDMLLVVIVLCMLLPLDFVQLIIHVLDS